ncbi:hypothetical protein [Teredinibacter turnerae]|uniref:hypothetical protein n=1 Tax=Teredinibacter turnerae TaxID=2426 RepID=UPI00048EE37C|nr:hypothetical protein [Teredinibacter turnerae]
MSNSNWKSYEEVACFLLNRYREYFGITQFQPKGNLVGIESGTIWELDAIGVNIDGEPICLVECRCVKNPQKQKDLASIAYQIKDCGADSGILVTSVEPQLGAKKVASSVGIQTVILSSNSTKQEFIMKFRSIVSVGLLDSLKISASFGGNFQLKNG